ncbi:TPA: hypothetical protein ACH3X3_007345 [Trebouxia sp. C0006]
MQTPSGQGSTILLPVLGSQVQEAFSTDDAWSTQSLRDKMVRLHGMGVLQTRAGCLLVLNDKRIDPNQLQDLTFCRQRKEGQVRQTRGQWSPHKAAEQEIVSIFKAVRRCVPGLKQGCHQAEGYEALPAAASLGV